MATEKEAQPVKPQSQAANKGVDAELSEEALRNIAGYFDVLIQMDLEQKRKERSTSDEVRIPNTTSSSA
jgi:hypothetical protein